MNTSSSISPGQLKNYEKPHEQWYGFVNRPSGEISGLGSRYRERCRTRLVGFARARRHMAHAADIARMEIVAVHHELAAALRARRSLKHSRLKKTHQRPGASKAQHRLHPGHPAMLQIELIAFNNGCDASAIGVPDQILVYVGKYGRMNIGLPGQE